MRVCLCACVCYPWAGELGHTVYMCVCVCVYVCVCVRVCVREKEGFVVTLTALTAVMEGSIVLLSPHLL